MAVLASCRFVTITDYESDLIPTITDTKRGFGLLSYEKYDNSCQPYDEGWNQFPESLGAAQLAARAFGIIALIIGCLLMIISWSICCIACDMRFIKGLAAAYGFVALCQAFVMLMFGSDLCKKNNCNLASSASVAIAAIILWATTSALCFKVSPSTSSGIAPFQKVHITEKINPDGTKEIIKETTSLNGTKIVETTKIMWKENSHKEVDLEVEEGMERVDDDDVEEGMEQVEL